MITKFIRLAVLALPIITTLPYMATADETRRMLTFTPDTVVEIAFSSIKPGMEEQLFGTYFPQVMPIVGEYGGNFLASFSVTEGQIDGETPQAIALFEWPSVDAFRAIGEDPRIPPLVAIRNETLSFINEANFFTIAAPVTLTLDLDDEIRLHLEDVEGALRLDAVPSPGLFKPEHVWISVNAAEDGAFAMRLNP